MMILQEHHNSSSNGIGYTWDDSWMLPYESIRSLLHKFAILNRISLADCKTIFKLKNNWEEGITELGGKLSIQKLTGIIGMGSSLDRNLVYGIAHSSDRQWLLSPYLRLCPTCSVLGFHSIFHQVTSIKKCPIHDADLVTATCQVCGSHELYDCMAAATGKYGGGAFTCAKCGHKRWQPYSLSGDSPHRNQLSITHEHKRKLDALYNWFAASAKIAPHGASLKRWEGMAGLLSFPAPVGMLPHKKSIYELRGQEVLVCRGIVIGVSSPGKVIRAERRGKNTSIAQYGFRGADRNTVQCSNSLSTGPLFDDSGIVYKEEDKAIYDTLRQVYKSIRRHFAKKFLSGRHKRCARSIEKAMWWEPGPDTNTQICPWAFAYLFWRRSWERRERANHPNKYVIWKNFLLATISADEPAQNFWATQRIFALECYWTFQESVLLARWMSSRQAFSWDPALIRGRLIPYWHVNNQINPRNPSIYWWPRKPIHSKALRLKVSIKRHHLDVAAQINILREI